jgi:hypothetical protein
MTQVSRVIFSYNILYSERIKDIENIRASWRYFIMPRKMISFNLIQALMNLAVLITLCLSVHVF